jgi:CDP-glucose 4,6-dehydratase
VLVTGATGIVGSAVCRRLVDEGALVVALVLDADPRSELIRSGTLRRLSVVNGALEDLGAVERAVVVHEVSTVLHLGAQTIVSAARRDPLATFEANVRGTWHVLEAARRHPDLVRRVVVASSDKAYGASDDLPYRESHPLAGRQPYEVSKSCADLISQSYAATYGVPVAVARCGNIYGPGDLNWSRIVPGTIRALLRGEQPVIRSDGSLVRDYLHVDDVVDAYLRLARALDEPGTTGVAYNFSDESPRSVLEVYAATCDAADASGTEPLVLGQASDELQAQYLDASAARTQLGWKPQVGLAEGLRSTVAWYRALLDDDPARLGA